MEASKLAQRIEDHAARVAVIGQGYVGLPLAVAFAGAGFDVTGLDADPERVQALNRGESHTPDVAGEDLDSLLRDGRYRAAVNTAVLEESEVVIICVPTPLRKSKDPDISFVVSAAHEVASHLRAGQLVILESTTYPGTTEELLVPMLAARGGRAGVDFFLAFSPERIDPGNSTYTVKDIPKVVGGVTSECGRLAALLYRKIVKTVVPVSSPKVAELAKLYENVFRNVNVALANELAIMCGRLDVSSREVIDAAATKPFGFMPFYPGPGIGGHCIPVDPLYLSWKMRLNGYEARFIQLAEEMNRSMPGRVVAMVGEALNVRRQCLNGASILILGVAYKRGVGDVRESPAFDVIGRLRRKGARVSYADPYVPSLNLEDGVLKSVEPTAQTIADADCVLILTDHVEFDYPRIVEIARLVVDARNATWGIPAPKDSIVRL